MRNIKKFRIFLLILIVIGVILLATQKLWVPELVNKILLLEGGKRAETDAPKKVEKTLPAISISSKNIKEENFSGKVAVISGASPLAVKMREYINETVAEFGREANTEVPPMREKFGEDSPSASFTIEINSKYIKGDKIESIVTDVYTYSGGAHGGTVYKVITADRASGKILTLSSIVSAQEQTAFTEFVKKQLNSWRPEGSSVSPVFPDEVKNLKFGSFANWSQDSKNLTIYFDQYAIGPGALGAVPFPLSLEKINNFLR